MTLSKHIRGYLQTYQKDYDYRHCGVVTSFEIDDLALSVGKFYEQIRKVIDWKEENALRRGAIARAIKRNLVAQIYNFDRSDLGGKIQDTAEMTVFELMRSGYFNNDLINAEKVRAIAKIIQKYITIFQDLNTGHEGLSRGALNERIKMQTWTIEVAACEIEECLVPPFKTQAIVQLMSDVLSERIRVVPTDSLSETEQEKHLQIAIWRSLFSADDYLLSHLLLKRCDPDFFHYQGSFDGRKVPTLVKHKQQITADLNNKIGRQFLRLTNKYDAAYRMIAAITNKAKLANIADGEKFFADGEKIQGFYTEIYQEKFRSLRSRLLRTAFWTTLSILIANAASVVILEIPIAKLLGDDFGIWAIIWDILIPSFAMFILVMLIRMPHKANEAAVWQEIKKIIYQTSENDVYEIRGYGNKTHRAQQFFFIASTIVAGVIGLWALSQMFFFAGLPVTSVYLNVVYITMVLFASLNIRAKSQEITIYERTGVFDFILDIFSIPLARIGQWFSKKWKEYNIFSIIFSVLIDAPLSLFIGFIENWRAFLKESKSEIR
jgi:hypothetical protein